VVPNLLFESYLEKAGVCLIFRDSVSLWDLKIKECA
jgi:hypothetical protein